MTPFGTHLPTLLSADRIVNLIKYSNACSHLKGYFCEFGVFGGGSLEILAKFNPKNECIGIDSFEGLPQETPGKDFHHKGEFNMVDFYAISGYFKAVYHTVRLFKGFSPDVFKVFDGNTRFSFVHVDVDLYQSVKDALDFFVPRLLTGGMILFDDYKFATTPGCEIAIKEFFESHPEFELSYHGELKYWDAVDAQSHFQYLIKK